MKTRAPETKGMDFRTEGQPNVSKSHSFSEVGHSHEKVAKSL